MAAAHMVARMAPRHIAQELDTLRVDCAQILQGPGAPERVLPSWMVSTTQ